MMFRGSKITPGIRFPKHFPRLHIQLDHVALDLKPEHGRIVK